MFMYLRIVYESILMLLVAAVVTALTEMFGVAIALFRGPMAYSEYRLTIVKAVFNEMSKHFADHPQDK